MEKQLLHFINRISLLPAGLIFLIYCVTANVKRCNLPCPRMDIRPNCLGKDYVILDDELCQSCDLDLCLLQEWPPSVAVPYCPTLNCNTSHIPVQCVIRQFRKINRRTVCRACDKDVCKNPPIQATTPSIPDVTIPPLCPKLRCKLTGIPKECLLPSYDVVNGQRCRQCDKDACRHPPALRNASKRKANY